MPEIFRQFDGSRSVTFNIHVPVLDWGQNKLKVEAAKIDLEQNKLSFDNQKKEIKQEILEILNNIKSAESRIEVLGKSIELAQKSFDISRQRFQAGTITSFELQQMQIRLTNAKINSLNALIDYKLALADLERKTLHNFEQPAKDKN